MTFLQPSNVAKYFANADFGSVIHVIVHFNHLTRPGLPSTGESKVAELERRTGKQTLEIDVKACLAASQEARMLQALAPSRPPSTG